MSETDWTPRDTNAAIAAQASPGLFVDLNYGTGAKSITSLRHFDTLQMMFEMQGATVHVGADLGVWPEGTRTYLLWTINPFSDDFASHVKKLVTLYANTPACVVVDITFPWRHPDQVTGPPNGWLDSHRVEVIESVLSQADVVTTSYEEIVPEIEELNPNVIYLPDHIPDREDDDSFKDVATALVAVIQLLSRKIKSIRK